MWEPDIPRNTEQCLVFGLPHIKKLLEISRQVWSFDSQECPEVKFFEVLGTDASTNGASRRAAGIGSTILDATAGSNAVEWASKSARGSCQTGLISRFACKYALISVDLVHKW